MSKQVTGEKTLLHRSVEKWILDEPTDPALEQRLQELATATAKVADLRAEQTATVARRGDVDRKMLSVASADRPPLHRELLEIESELRVLVRLIETAEADRLRTHLTALARVDAVIRAERAELAARAAEIMPTLRGLRTPEGMEKARPLWEERARIRQRGERLESMQRLIRAIVNRVGEHVDITNPRTWEAPVTKAAARAMRAAA
jgi:hypothetical protein